MIRETCQSNGIAVGKDGITIGSVESFQGKERPIIIVSTVRTNGALGFVQDERVSLSHFSTI